MEVPKGQARGDKTDKQELWDTAKVSSTQGWNCWGLVALLKYNTPVKNVNVSMACLLISIGVHVFSCETLMRNGKSTEIHAC